MNNTNKEELTEMLFKLIEDIGHTEELIEEVKQETQLIKETIQQNMPDTDKLSLMQEELERQAKIIDSFIGNTHINDAQHIESTIKDKLIALEKDIKNIKNTKNNILDSINVDELSNISDTMAQKIILKKEITRWQIIIIGILIAFSILSIGFFVSVNEISLNTLTAYIGFCVPFCIAMYFINSNLKNLISNKKAYQ